MFDSLMPAAEAFIREHHVWAGVIVGVLCFLESVVFISLFVPATVLLIAAGGLVGSGLVGWTDVLIGGIIGCLLGDTASYWLGRYLGPHADKVWPFKHRPDMLEKGEAFFAKNGWWGVFIGRFFGPLRAVIPTCAGIMGMPHLAFQGVSIASAIVFVPLMLAPGALAVAGAQATASGQILSILPMVLLIGVPAVVMAVYLYRYKKQHAAEIPDEDKRA